MSLRATTYATGAATDKVSKAGDTMTGDLKITNADIHMTADGLPYGSERLTVYPRGGEPAAVFKSGGISAHSRIIQFLSGDSAFIGTIFGDFEGPNNGLGFNVAASADFRIAMSGTIAFRIASTGVATFSHKVNVPASAAATATFNIPHGAAPTSPVDGDIWTTTAGLYVRINGATVGPLA